MQVCAEEIIKVCDLATRNLERLRLPIHGGNNNCGWKTGQTRSKKRLIKSGAINPLPIRFFNRYTVIKQPDHYNANRKLPVSSY